MKLVFQNAKGKKKTIANVDSKEQAHAEILKFCEDRNYTVYIMRLREKNDIIYYDVGSWHEFFLLYLNE